MSDCSNCENKKWKEHYIIAQERFDKYMTMALVGLVITFKLADEFLCLDYHTNRYKQTYDHNCESNNKSD